MSNYHILTASEDGNALTVVFHIPIPVENNAVGSSLQAVIATEQGAVTSQVKNIDLVEQTQLNNGELFEYAERFHTNPGQTLAQKRAALDARYTQLTTSILARLRERFAYYGYGRNVA